MAAGTHADVAVVHTDIAHCTRVGSIPADQDSALLVADHTETADIADRRGGLHVGSPREILVEDMALEEDSTSGGTDRAAADNAGALVGAGGAQRSVSFDSNEARADSHTTQRNCFVCTHSGRNMIADGAFQDHSPMFLGILRLSRHSRLGYL